MALFFGSDTPSTYYLGDSSVNSIYFGSNKVWPVPFVGEVFTLDFNETASYTLLSRTTNNISVNKDYIAGNMQTMSVNSTASAFTDPSGSGVMMKFSASSGATFGVQQLMTIGVISGSLFAITQSVFSMEAWIRPYPKNPSSQANLSGPNLSPIMSIYPTWHFGVSNHLTNDAAMVVYQFDAAKNFPRATTAANVINFNEWNHLVYTFSRSGSNSVTFTMYKNGVLQPIIDNQFAQQGITLTVGSVGNMNIGRAAVSGSSVINSIFDLSVIKAYNKVLTASEVLTLFSGSRARYGI